MTHVPPARRTPIRADEVPARAKKSNYPDVFARRVEGREKRQLGDVFGLTNFGVNLTRLAPGAESSLLHRHFRQDEFIFVLEGTPTLVTDEGEYRLGPGDCMGFAANGLAHQLVNRGETDVVYLEIGDRLPGDSGEYPADDLRADLGPDGKWQFRHKDGRPY